MYVNDFVITEVSKRHPLKVVLHDLPLKLFPHNWRSRRFESCPIDSGRAPVDNVTRMGAIEAVFRELGNAMKMRSST